MSDNPNLTQSKCQPCEGLGQKLTLAETLELQKQTPHWIITTDELGITRDYVCKNFMAAVSFVNAIATIAEEEDHHPDIHLTGYRNVKIELTTHALKGLSKNDFILAAKIDELPVELKS